MSHYMTERERYQLEAYLKAGKPISWIAREIGCTRQTIYNEKRRGMVKQIRTINGYYRDVLEYSADKAQQLHRYAQTAKGRPIKLGNHYDYAQRLENLMLGVQPDGTIDRRKRYSPWAALEITRAEGYPVSVCVSTLYSYIDKGIFLRLTNKDLWEKSKRRKRGYHPISRVAHPHLPSIEKRPEVINTRQEPGHWEIDLVLGKNGTRAALLTLTERITREEVILKIPNRKAASVVNALASWREARTEEMRSITTDNGSEFLAYEALRKASGCETVYYCHSYAAWEKGTNERHNRIIRRWYPKGSSFEGVSQEELNDLARWMNHYPRRSLHRLTPYHLSQALAGNSLRE